MATVSIEFDYQPIPRYEACIGGYIVGEIILDQETRGCWDNDHNGECWRVIVHGHKVGDRGTLARAKELLIEQFRAKGPVLVRRKAGGG